MNTNPFPGGDQEEFINSQSYTPTENIHVPQIEDTQTSVQLGKSSGEALKKAFLEDILSIQEMQGTNLLYEERNGVLFAYQLDEEGDVIARYTLHVNLEKV